jgi:hypothetical protein
MKDLLELVSFPVFLLMCFGFLLKDADHSHPPALPLTGPALKGFIGVSDKSGREGVEFTSAVREHKGEFEYTYVFENVGKKKSWLVGSCVLDRAMGLGNGDVSGYFKLKPGKSTKVKILHKNPPVLFSGKWVCVGKSKNDLIDLGITVTGTPVYYSSMSTQASGWIPKGRAPKNE